MTFSIFPRTVYKTKSKTSGPIEVKEQLGSYTLHVDNLIQSGGLIRGIWKKALRSAQGKLSVSNCLILGLGGGTVVQLIKVRYPKAKITGIEIDPEIIKIGKRFFGLDKVENLKIINADAFDWIKARSNDSNHLNKKFNLIIIDLYLGSKFLKKAAGDEFLKDIKKLLSKKGIIIFNRLISRGEDLVRFEEKLKKHFSFVKTIKTHTNLLFLARS